MPFSSSMARRSFRNEQVAAPLKHCTTVSGYTGAQGIPQRTSCGPIEAPDHAGTPPPVMPFRNEQVAAPLKLVNPRSRSLHSLSFRNEQVAAPLKQRGGKRPAAAGGPFRNEQVAAPLKRGRVGRPRRARPPFRNEQVAAPLKHHPPVFCVLHGLDHSATNKLRPH